MTSTAVGRRTSTLRSSALAAKITERGWTWLLILATAALVLTPVVWVFHLSLEDSAAGVRSAVNSGQLSDLLSRTAILAVGSVAISLVLGTALAWAAHRLPARRQWMALIPITPLFVPGLVLATGWMFLLSPRVGYINSLLRQLPFFDGRSGPLDVYSELWIIILTGWSATGFVYLFLRSSLAQFNQEVLDAAAASGAAPWRVFTSVVLPLLRPGLVYGAATTLLLCVGQVTFPLVLGRQKGINVLSTAMYQYSSQSLPNYGAAAALGLPIVGLGLACLVLQRFMLRDQNKYATVGHGVSRPVRTTGIGGQAFILAFGMVALVLPLYAIVYVSLSRFWTATMNFQNLNTDAYRQVFDDNSFFIGVKNSLWYSLLALVIVLPLGYLSAKLIFVRQQRRVAAAAQETIVGLPIGIPSIIFGVGFLFAYVSQPISRLGIYGTTWSMVLVYVVLVLPFSVRMQLAGMASVGRSLEEAASTSGAATLRRSLTIQLPMLRPALGSAAALIIALLAQEFSASLLVRAGTTQVMSTALYDALANGSYPVAAALAVVMFAVTALAVGLAVVLGGRSAIEGFGR